MLKLFSTGRKAVLLVILVLFLDQFLKIWVKTHLYYNQSIPVFGFWFRICFIENDGMAFGMEFGGSYGKILLTLVRILAVSAIAFYLHFLLRQKANRGLVYAIALVLAGAAGNIFDSVFYGVIFSESTTYQLAVLFPKGGGYASFLHGKVVDMLFFPLYNGNYPGWMPFIGGREMTFFEHVFNLADASITTGVLIILVFRRRYFHAGLTAPVKQ